MASSGGEGINGGDAFAVARHLFNMGAITNVYVFSEIAQITGDAKTNLDILVKMGIEIQEITTDEKIADIEAKVKLADIVGRFAGTV